MAKIERLDNYRVPPRPAVDWSIWVWVAVVLGIYCLGVGLTVWIFQ